MIERDMELEERSDYLLKTGWNWNFPTRSKRPSRKLFASEDNQLLRPQITVYRR